MKPTFRLLLLILIAGLGLSCADIRPPRAEGVPSSWGMTVAVLLGWLVDRWRGGVVTALLVGAGALWLGVAEAAGQHAAIGPTLVRLASDLALIALILLLLIRTRDQRNWLFRAR